MKSLFLLPNNLHIMYFVNLSIIHYVGIRGESELAVVFVHFQGISSNLKVRIII